jgi:uncharacterized protein YceH (UPF0502 family)
LSAKLDRTERRVVGVLIEKELSVPDLYPLTETALLAGCNQKSNRDPVMELADFELQGALLALRIKQWVSKSERDGGRAVRYRHEAGDRLGVDAKEKAILAELLLRGPQTPGELKTRVARMGFAGSVPDVHAVLEGLRGRPDGALVELLPRGLRERDARWAHLLAPKDEAAGCAEEVATGPRPVPAAPPAAAPATPERAELAEPPVAAGEGGLARRVRDLEEQVASLQAEVRRLGARLEELAAGPGAGPG